MSNDLGLIPVLSSKEDDKLSAPHLGEWLTFLLMAAALIALPVLVYVPKTVTFWNISQSDFIGQSDARVI